MTAAREFINGVPADEYGTWCPHGFRIVAPDLTDPSEHPRCVYVEPWPCSAEGCTREAHEEYDREIAAAYEAERWAEYRASQ